MAAGITEGIGSNEKGLISFHPQPSESGSVEWFHNDN
jgi:hypothetical protein